MYTSTHKTKIKLFAIIFPVLFFVLLNVQTIHAQEVATSTEKTSVLFLGNKNLAPVISLNRETPNGVAIDIVRAVSQYISLPVDIQTADWAEAQKLVAEGGADALIQINPTKERRKIYDFSGPLLETHISVFTRTAQGVQNIESLHNLRVGVEAGGLPEQLLKEHPGVLNHSEITLVFIENFLDGFNLLKNDSLDAVVVDERVGKYILATNNIRGIKISGDPIYSSYSAIAVKKGNELLLNEINEGLQKIKADGTYQKILDSWSAQDVIFQTQEEATQEIYLITSVTLGGLLLVTIIWVIAIKIQIGKRRSLEKHEAEIQKELQRKDVNLHQSMETARDGVIVMGADGTVTFWNKAAEQIFGYTKEEAIGRDLHRLIASPEDQAVFKERFHKFLATGDGPIVNVVRELTAIRKNGEQFPVELSVSASKIDSGWIATGIVRDISERKKAENELKATTKNLNDAQRVARIGSWELDIKTNKLIWSNEIFEIFEIDQTKFGATYEAFLDAVHPEDKDAVSQAYTNSLKTKESYSIDHRLLMKDGRIKYVHEECTTHYASDGTPLRSVGTVQDITERKKAELDISKKSRALRMLSDTNNALIHADNEKELLDQVCEIMTKEGGYRLVWIGGIEHDQNMTIRPMAQVGFEDGYLESLNWSWGDTDRGQGPEGVAARTNAPIIVHNIATDPKTFLWHEDAKERGYQSLGVFPIADDKGAFAVMGIYAGEPTAFSEDEIEILKEMTDDLAFGITTLHERKEHELAEEKFTATFHASPDAMIIVRLSDNKILDVNEAFSQILGYAHDDVVGGSTNDFPVWVDSADRSTFEKTIAEKGTISGFETPMRKKDGGVIESLGSARTIDINGEKCILSTIHDITERNRTEKQRLANLKFIENTNKINQVIQKSTDFEQTMSSVLDAMLSIFGSDRAWLITPCDPWSLHYRVPMERSRPEYPGASVSGMDVPVDPDTTILFQKTRATDGPVVFNSETDPPLPPEITKHFQVQSQIVMDIYPRVGESWMIGMRQCSYERVWTEEEKRLFQEIGHRVSDALTSLLISRDLKKSEEKYRRIIETSNEGIAILDKDRKLTFVNTRFAKLLGYEEREMLGEKFDAFLAPSDLADHELQMKARREGKSSFYDRQFVHKNGNIIWCSVSATPLFDDKGEFNGSFGMFTDITERKKAEEGLQEQEQYSQSLLRFSRKVEQSQMYGEVLKAAQEEIKTVLGYNNVWAYLVDADKKYAHSIAAVGSTSEMVMSEEFSATLTITGDPMLEAIASAKEIVIVADAMTDPNVNREIVEKMKNRTIVNVPIILFDRNLGSVGMGTFGDEGVRVPTPDEEDFLIAMASHMAVGFDRIRLLAERKKTEEILRRNEEQLVEAQRVGHFGSFEWDARTDTAIWSKEFYHIYGVDPSLPAPPLQDYLKLYTPESAAIMTKAVETIVKTGEAYSLDLEQVRPDGARRWIHLQGEAKYDEQHNFIGVRGTAQDITKAKEVERMRVDFLSLASHQLRTPLSGTKWLIETLEKELPGPLTTGQREYLEEIYKINERMTRLVSDMLVALRVDSSESVLVKKPISIPQLFDDLMLSVKAAAASRKITIRSRTSEHSLPQVESDMNFLSIILGALMANAINYSPEGAEIVFDVNEEENGAVLSVQDFGIGIPQEEQAHIFERFFRAVNAKMIRPEGTGLGLYIAKMIAEKLGGTVTFTSEPGKGSTFSLHIPNHNATVKAEAPTQ